MKKYRKNEEKNIFRQKNDYNAYIEKKDVRATNSTLKFCQKCKLLPGITETVIRGI